MTKYVEKRDGKVVKFDGNKIIEAISKAFVSTGYTSEDHKELLEKISKEIENSFNEKISVENIQDLIERKLMASSYKDVAKSFITYRHLRALARSQYQEFWNAIEDKLLAKHVQNQNANLDERSFGGRIGETSGVVTKKYALEHLMSPMARSNHENNEIYIHDLDSYAQGSHNCLTLPIDELLAKGFNTRQTDVRPAGSANTAFQLLAVTFQVQSLQQFGGVSASHLDWSMVPYVRKSFHKHYMTGWKYIAPDIRTSQAMVLNITETSITDSIYTKTQYSNVPQELVNRVYNYALDMTKKEIHQAVEGMYHNLNY